MGRHGQRLIAMLLLLCATSFVYTADAQPANAQPVGAQPAGENVNLPPSLPEQSQTLSPRALVREGNRLLLADEPSEAIEAYERARQKEPNAPEIDFVTGLARYALGDYEQARAAFEDAAAAKDPSLVDDALYSIGTTYHAQALANSENPQGALAQLEQAMQRYQSVLAHRPDHEAARDANYKAATKWRAIKTMLEQQQEQQESQDQEQEQEESEQSEDDQQQPGGHQSEDDQQNDQQQQSQDEEQQGDQSQQAPKDQEDQQQEGEQKQAEASEKEEATREQAERKLREMMQALRDRNRRRQEQVQPGRLVPVDKDW